MLSKLHPNRVYLLNDDGPGRKKKKKKKKKGKRNGMREEAQTRAILIAFKVIDSFFCERSVKMAALRMPLL